MSTELKDEVQDFIDECEAILQDFDNSWCFNTVEGMMKWSQNNNHVTENQLNALGNIKRKIEGDL